MKRERASRDSEASLSFLDVIACAFGAIVLLVLVLPVGESGGPQSGIGLGEYGGILLDLAELAKAADTLDARLAADRKRADALEDLLSARQDASFALSDLVARARNDLDAVRARTAATEEARSAVEAAARRRRPTDSEPTDYAGIPVDSEFVAFVVDTSGSMQAVWPRVRREVANVLSIYPEIRGFQILNASGAYLWKPRVWIRDGPGNRGVAKARLGSVFAPSVSNPEPGILAAVRDLYRPGIKMAIFVFGDDYRGTDYDNFLASVRAGVDRHASGGGALRIHAFGFPSQEPSVQRAKYATLMRELTGRHGGAFLALSR